MNKKILFGIVFLFLIVLAGYLANAFFWRTPDKKSIVSFEIKSGENLSQVGSNLQKTGLLENPFLFKIYFKLGKLEKNIQPGIFKIGRGNSVSKLVKIITNRDLAGKKLTFLEGWTVRDYLEYLKKNNLADEKNANELSKSGSLEGYLFPDTYFVPANITLKDLIKIMRDNFNAKAGVILEQAARSQKKTALELLTVASLVEAEANTEEDRRLTADIIWRRLDIGMPLQLDSTVNYVTGNKKPAISLAEQTIESLFNTYKYKGLPPWPINNPGLAAIMAAIAPKRNDYWFFLTGNDGKMYYARNLKEHEENKNRYLR